VSKVKILSEKGCLTNVSCKWTAKMLTGSAKAQKSLLGHRSGKKWGTCLHTVAREKLGDRQLAAFHLLHWSATKECPNWAYFLKEQRAGR